MSVLTRAEQATAYLATLICASPPDAHHLELRWRGDNTPMRADWFAEPSGLWSSDNLRSSLAPIAQRALTLADQGKEVFAGVSMRTRQEGTKDAVPSLGVAWVDCDSPEATTRLASFAFGPSMIVRSSPGKVHAYFRLERPHPAEIVEDVNRRLAIAVGADERVSDAARILRVPGTYNRKAGAAHPVYLLANRPRVTRLDDLLNVLPAPPAPASAPRMVAPRMTMRSDDLADLRAIPATTYVPLMTGREVGRDGKVCCPFHGTPPGSERTPSLHVYPDAERGWFCFSCQAGGDALDFTARLLGGLDTRRDFPRIVAALRGFVGGTR